MTDWHFLSLSTAQMHALAAQLNRMGLGGPMGPPISIVNGRRVAAAGPPGLVQWVQLANGRWISEKDPGYPFLAAPFQALNIIRLAPLFYGALGCVGLFFGARRWLGRWGGAAAVGLFCSSGAAMLFAWRDYMPTFTDASLIAAGTGALLWAVLATEASVRRRTWVGLLGFVALEAATFARYTDIVMLGCAVVAVLIAWRVRSARVSAPMLGWWLGSVAVFGVGVAVFDDLVYGGVLQSGYRPGEIQFSLSAIAPNFRYMPAHLIQAMPMLVLGLAAVVWIIWRRIRLRRTPGEPAVAGSDLVTAGREPSVVRRDFAVGLALAASWFGIWGLYSAYTWTAQPGGSSLQVVRFYLPAIGAIALLGAWLLVRVPPRTWLAGATSAAVVVALFGLGIWSYNDMRVSPFGGAVAKGGVVCAPARAGRPRRPCQVVPGGGRPAVFRAKGSPG
jgi:hypothetical protein